MADAHFSIYPYCPILHAPSFSCELTIFTHILFSKFTCEILSFYFYHHISVSLSVNLHKIFQYMKLDSWCLCFMPFLPVVSATGRQGKLMPAHMHTKFGYTNESCTIHICSVTACIACDISYEFY